MAKKGFYPLILGVLVLFSWACNHVYTPNAPVITIPSATPTPTPGCGISIVGGLNFLLPFGTATPMTTPQGTPVPTPAITPYASPIASPVSGVIRTLADWNAAYPSTPPPVDFNQQMIVPVTLYEGCNGSDFISNVCWDDQQVTVSLVNQEIPPGFPICNHTDFFYPELLAVPQRNLPVVIETIGYFY
jgi:hypothetical protein